MVFGVIQVHGHDAVQAAQFIFGQVILGNGHVRLAHFLAFPTGEAHIGFDGGGAFRDQFSSGMPGNGPVQFVLHAGVKLMGDLRVGIVVHGQAVDLGDFAIKLLFGSADIANAFEQLVKIVRAQPAPFFQAIIVHHKTFHQELAQPFGRPAPELGAAVGFDAVTNRKNHLQIIEINLPGDFPFAFFLNYPEFPDGCFRVKFTFCIDGLDVFIDGADILLVKVRHHFLAQPNRCIFKTDFQAGISALGLIHDNFGSLFR